MTPDAPPPDMSTDLSEPAAQAIEKPRGPNLPMSEIEAEAERVLALAQAVEHAGKVPQSEWPVWYLHRRDLEDALKRYRNPQRLAVRLRIATEHVKRLCEKFQ